MEFTTEDPNKAVIDKYCEAYPYLDDIRTDFKAFVTSIKGLAVPKGVTLSELWSLISADFHALLVERGRKGGRARTPAKANGGKALAASMTPEERSARASKAAAARWKLTPEQVSTLIARIVADAQQMPEGDDKFCRLALTKFSADRHGYVYSRCSKTVNGVVRLGIVPLDRLAECLTELYTTPHNNSRCAPGVNVQSARETVAKYAAE